MVKWWFTLAFVEYAKEKLNDYSENPLTHPIVVGIIPACKLGWSMGNFFPYEVAIMTSEEAQRDQELQQMEIVQKPAWMAVFVDISLIEDLDTNMILDYIPLKDIEFPFIPLNPDPLDQYNFYQIDDLAWMISWWKQIEY